MSVIAYKNAIAYCWETANRFDSDPMNGDFLIYRGDDLIGRAIRNATDVITSVPIRVNGQANA